MNARIVCFLLVFRFSFDFRNFKHFCYPVTVMKMFALINCGNARNSTNKLIEFNEKTCFVRFHSTQRETRAFLLKLAVGEKCDIK